MGRNQPNKPNPKGNSQYWPRVFPKVEVGLKHQRASK